MLFYFPGDEFNVGKNNTKKFYLLEHNGLTQL